MSGRFQDNRGAGWGWYSGGVAPKYLYPQLEFGIQVEDFCHNSFALALIRPFCRTCGSEMGVGLGIAAVRPRAARHD